MPQLEYEYFSNHPIDLIYGLVIDIEKYPEFIPWCVHAEIIESYEAYLIADLSINYKLLCETYRSMVSFSAPHDKKAIIDVSLISGPFKKLINKWNFIEVEKNKTKINFFIDFEFKSALLDKLVSLMFYKACEKMVSAFESRADELLKKLDGPENLTKSS